MRILIAWPRHELLAAWLRERRPDLELRTRALAAEVTADDLAWAEAMIGFRRPAVAGWGSLHWIHSIGAGTDGFLFRSDLPGHVVVTRSPEDFGPAIGEWCVARALAVTQHLSQLATAQRARQWSSMAPVPLAGARVLVAGTGMVGAGIAQAFSGLGCVVDGLSRTGQPASGFRAVHRMDAFAAAIAGARWLVLALPLTEGTHHLFNRERLSQCGGAYLMNAGRGATVDEAAIPEAIDRGWLSGAALDVFAVEPLPADSPLWHHPGITISPHCSAPSTLEVVGEGFLECLAALERGERPRWAVDRTIGY